MASNGKITPGFIQAEAVTDILEASRRKAGPDDSVWTAREHFMLQIAETIARGEPIRMVLPAFPCKSANSTDKVLGHLPDGAEDQALRQLEEMLEQINQHHPAELVIVSDGRVFADILRIPDQHVTDYGNQLRKMIRGDQIRFMHLEDLVPESNPDKLRQFVVEEFGRSEEEIRADTLAGGKLNGMYCGMSRFISGCEKRDRSLSSRQLRKRAKQVSLGVIQRSEAYSGLVAQHFPGWLRLSIHPHPGSTEKLGINLVANNDGWGTPWHNVLVKDSSGEVELMWKEKAEELGFKLIEKNGRPWMYQR